MDEPMGRRTVGGLLFTKGGSILLFREDGSHHKANSCCSRHGCSSRHSADKAKGKEPHRAGVPNESAPATPRRSQVFRNPNRKPMKPHESSVRWDGGSSVASSETGNRSRDNPGRDLLARLKERVNASRRRSLTRENSPPSSSTGLSASSSPSSRNISSRPSHRSASRIRKADEGPSAGSDRARRNGTRNARRNSERSDDDLLLVNQITRDTEPAAAEGFLSGFTARYRSGFQGALSSLEDTMEDSNGYWRFDMGGTEELENYFVFNDRHRGMRMDIDGMSYEELLALGERIGTVNTGLSDDELSKCLNRSPYYMPTPSSSHEDCDRKCSICQEEYLEGDEVGKMACKHYYHVSCIQHWLRQKKWCPICKSVARDTN